MLQDGTSEKAIVLLIAQKACASLPFLLPPHLPVWTTDVDPLPETVEPSGAGED